MLNKDTATVNRLSDLYENRNIGSGEYRNIDPGLAPNDLLQVARNGDIRETNLIVKRDGEIRWLSKGDRESGWEHIKRRHIQGYEKSAPEKDGTSFWPVGQQVEGRDLPNKITEREMKDIIYDAIKDGEPSGGSARVKTEYMLRPSNEGYPESGLDQVRVVVQGDGSVESAFPEKGDAVAKWQSGHGWVK